MTNYRKEGSAKKQECKRLLENLGWMVGDVERNGRFIKEKDLFGLFDLVGVRKGGLVILAQVTRTKPHVHKKYVDFKKAYGGENIIVVQYVWILRKGWERYLYREDGTWQKVVLY